VSTDTGHSAAETEPEPGKPRRPGKMWKLVLGGLVGIFAVLACYDLASGLAGSTGASAGSASPSPTEAAASPSAVVPTTPAPRPSPASSTAAPRVLDVASIAAFGPEGPSDGDNPGIVSRILAATADQPWYSQWYATPEFGNLRSGTGVLLDMGKTVKVTDVRLMLGTEQGADIQVRVGNSPYLADLSPKASARDAGGVVRLAAKDPAEGRYVLIWFTRLPPDSQGHYQVSVYSAFVDGTGTAPSSG
jgi:hypothetical protein